MNTFEVSLSTYLRINPDSHNNNHTVIIRESWGFSRNITNWYICDGYYIDREDQRIPVKNSDVKGIDFQGNEFRGSIMCASVLLPIELLKGI